MIFADTPSRSMKVSSISGVPAGTGPPGMLVPGKPVTTLWPGNMIPSQSSACARASADKADNAKTAHPMKRAARCMQSGVAFCVARWGRRSRHGGAAYAVGRQCRMVGLPFALVFRGDARREKGEPDSQPLSSSVLAVVLRCLRPVMTGSVVLTSPSRTGEPRVKRLGPRT